MPRKQNAVSIMDVASRAQVSTATVSRVLNGKGNVDPALAAAVRQAVRETGYTPNITGRALRRQVSDVWAAIVPDIENPFFTAVVAALESVAISNGYSLMLFNTNERLDQERRYVEAVVSQRMAGVVLAVSSERDSDISPITSAGIPLVLIDRRLRGYLGDAVFVDNLTAGRQAAKHLIAQGFTDIACIAGPEDVSTTEDRLSGLREELEAAGIGLRPEWVRRSNLRFEGGEIALRSLVSNDPVPKAVYVTNGPITAGAFRAAQQLEIEIPATLGIVGTDDDQWTRMVAPAVTVIAQPTARIGKLAGECLVARSNDPIGAGQQITLAPSLLARDSS
ncbi:MAG: LacI family transcriptional regulator [Propionibacteriaceae bacterium]|nr:LacI family transcriptional regulator [Propionibacteriaceae bacterium]